METEEGSRLVDRIPGRTRNRPEESIMTAERDDESYRLHLSIHDIRLIHYSVQEAIKYWPGAPARPYEEQEHLWYLRDEMFRCLMEHSFHQDPPAER